MCSGALISTSSSWIFNILCVTGLILYLPWFVVQSNIFFNVQSHGLNVVIITHSSTKWCFLYNYTATFLFLLSKKIPSCFHFFIISKLLWIFISMFSLCPCERAYLNLYTYQWNYCTVSGTISSFTALQHVRFFPLEALGQSTSYVRPYYRFVFLSISVLHSSRIHNYRIMTSS